MARKYKMMFDAINGDDPLEPDCVCCYNSERCRHKNKNPCTFEMITNMKVK